MNAFELSVSRIRGEGLFFSSEAPVYISRAPGRLDLMGGNVDYTGGLVFQSTIREATWAAAQRRSDRRIVFLNPQMKEEGWQEQVEFDLQDLSSEQAVRVWSTPALAFAGRLMFWAHSCSFAIAIRNRSKSGPPFTLNPKCLATKASALRRPWKWR